jgi:hypothetical protein
VRDLLRWLAARITGRFEPCDVPGPGDWRCIRRPRLDPMHWNGTALWHGSWKPDPGRQP